MATYTPPPYFPQSALSPPDEKRYRKFKLIIGALIVFLVGFVAVAVVGMVYLVKWIVR